MADVPPADGGGVEGSEVALVEDPAEFGEDWPELGDGAGLLVVSEVEVVAGVGLEVEGLLGTMGDFARLAPGNFVFPVAAR